MRRPGPLQEIPLVHFVHGEVSINDVSTKSTPKRPLSPSNSLSSPTKRRILREEGFLKEQESFYSPGRRWTLRKMDGESQPSQSKPKVVDGDMNSLHITSSLSTPAFRSERASSSLKPKRAPIHLARDPRQISVPTLSNVQQCDSASMDRVSAHYPGFDVFFDEKSHLLCLQITTKNGLEDRNFVMTADDGKENVAPRRRLKRKSSAFDEFSKAVSYVDDDQQTTIRVKNHDCQSRPQPVKKYSFSQCANPDSARDIPEALVAGIHKAVDRNSSF